MVTDAKDFELLGDPLKMTGYSRPPETKLTAVTRILGISTAVAMMMHFVSGLSTGWASPYLAQFAADTTPFFATSTEISWMASTLHLGRFVGAILGAVCVQYFGSKTTMIGNGCALIIAWGLIVITNSVSWIFVSRIICGAAIEIGNISFPLYLGDISRSTIRGGLVALAANGFPLGVLAGNIIGSYISMRLYASVTLVPVICFILIFLWVPHSPYYLTSKGRIEDAENSILRYDPEADVYVEIECIKRFTTMTKSMTFFDRLREFNIPRNRKAGFTLVALYMFSQCSGINPLTSYMETIVTRGEFTFINPAMVPIIANSLGIMAGWSMVYLAERFGRRIMWIVSSFGACGSLIALGTHFYLLGAGFDPATLQWLPIFCMISFQISANLGLICIPAIIQSELFASNIRTLAACGACISASIFALFSMSSYQYLIELIDEGYVYWIYAVFMPLSVIFGWMLVPETKGKTLLQIQDGMMKN